METLPAGDTTMVMQIPLYLFVISSSGSWTELTHTLGCTPTLHRLYRYYPASPVLSPPPPLTSTTYTGLSLHKSAPFPLQATLPPLGLPIEQPHLYDGRLTGRAQSLRLGITLVVQAMFVLMGEIGEAVASCCMESVGGMWTAPCCCIVANSIEASGHHSSTIACDDLPYYSIRKVASSLDALIFNVIFSRKQQRILCS